MGIQDVCAEVLPDEKAAKVRELQALGLRLAIELADVVLVGERLKAVVDAYYIGQRQNPQSVSAPT